MGDWAIVWTEVFYRITVPQRLADYNTGWSELAVESEKAAERVRRIAVMAVRLVCRACGKRLKLPDGAERKRSAKCPKCLAPVDMTAALEASAYLPTVIVPIRKPVGLLGADDPLPISPPKPAAPPAPPAAPKSLAPTKPGRSLKPTKPTAQPNRRRLRCPRRPQARSSGPCFHYHRLHRRFRRTRLRHRPRLRHRTRGAYAPRSPR